MIKIGHKTISENSPVFIVAEAGVNHNGSFKLAKKLIDEASRAKVDAIKFQTFNPDTLVVKGVNKADYQIKNECGIQESQHEMLSRLMLKREFHSTLKKYAESKNLIFISTPFSADDADFLKKIKIKVIKIGSTDTDNIPYLNHVAKFNLPIILSTGMSALPEIKEAVKTIGNAGNKNLIVLHCTTNYPTPHEQANLRAIASLAKNLKTIVGFSDHTLGIEAPIAAVALGAKVIEKHFTLDRNMPGPDHKASLEPQELKTMVEAIRNIEKALGSGDKVLFPSEKKIAKVTRKSLVVAYDISAGKKIIGADIVIKRPGTGIRPKFLNKVIGKTAKKNIKKDDLIQWQDLK